MASTRSSRWGDLAGAFAIGAGLVHAAAAGTHSSDLTLIRLFALTALVQCGAGAALLLDRSRRVLAVGIAVNVLAVAAWVVSRTVGLPVIDALAGREAVGTQDLSAAALGAASVLCSLVAVLATRTTSPAVAPARIPRWLPVLAVVPAFIGIAAPHAHSGDHEDGATTPMLSSPTPSPRSPPIHDSPAPTPAIPPRRNWPRPSP